MFHVDQSGNLVSQQGWMIFVKYFFDRQQGYDESIDYDFLTFLSFIVH